MESHGNLTSASYLCCRLPKGCRVSRWDIAFAQMRKPPCLLMGRVESVMLGEVGTRLGDDAVALQMHPRR